MMTKHDLHMNKSTAEGRWASVGPYYAMFQYNYAAAVVKKYTEKGDSVLDPFAGRYSSVAAASYAGRVGVGIEINPLGWLYGRVKLNPARRVSDVLRRLDEMSEIASSYKEEAKEMSKFFQMCYCPKVLRLLLACRKQLEWKQSIVDATLMANILVSLHHQIGRGLSNQMRQAKALSPQYSVKWWKENHYTVAPRLDPKSFLECRIKWRYENGVPHDEKSRAYLGDSCVVLNRLERRTSSDRRFKLLFTSPPYYSLVNYFKDQWLRLWMLGGKEFPVAQGHKYKRAFSNQEEYRRLLKTVFSACAKIMRDDGVIVVRTDARQFTRKITEEILQECFPEHRVRKKKFPMHGKGQSALFNKQNGDNGGELGIVLLPV